MQSLAVKYRPKFFDDVIGQDDAKRILSNMIKDDKLPGMLIFTGNTGVGKTTLARIVARYLNSDDGKGNSKCESCQIFDNDPDSHPDFKEINVANTRGIDDMRALIKMSAYQPRYHTRIILLDEVHQLTSQSSQILLKSTEEPPKNTLWILATTNPEKLPKALMNRGVHIHLNPVDTKELAKRLFNISKIEKSKISKELAIQIAQYSGGLVRNAISMLEKVLASKDDSEKVLEDGFLNTEEMEMTHAIAGLLISMYEDDKLKGLQYIAEIKDFSQAVTKMPFMNGFVMYSILKKIDRNIKNPYFPTPDNRLLYSAIEPDVKDKKSQTQYVNRCISVTRKVKELRDELFGTSTLDGASIAIAVLLGKE